MAGGREYISAREALGQSVHTDRYALSFGLFCLALGLLPVFVFYRTADVLTLVDLVLVGVGLIAMSYNVVLLPKRDPYRRLRMLTRTAALILLAILANALLGQHAEALSTDRMPWIISIIAIAPIYFHAYQLRPDADRLTWLFSMAATAVFCLHFMLIGNSGLTASAVWLGIVLSVGPLHVRVLLQLQVGIQGAMRGQLAKKLATLERERDALHALLDGRKASTSP